MKKMLASFLALILPLIIAGWAEASCTSYPTVTGQFPASNATGVGISTTVTATFSQAMDNTTITTSNFTLKQGSTTVATSIAYNASSETATITPSVTLAYNTVYTATLTTSLKNTNGCALQSQYQWQFTTAADTTPPVVSSVYPADGVTLGQVAPNPKISVTFSENISCSSITTSTFTVNNGTSNISGTIGCSGTTNQATFTPTANMVTATTYAATVTTGVTDLAGNHLASNYVWHFSIDTTNPTVTTTTPSYSATTCPGTYVNANNPSITATFSDHMLASTITTTNFYLRLGTNSISGADSYTDATKTATFTPGGTLSDGCYIATVLGNGSSGVSNTDVPTALYLGSNYVWAFTVDTTPPTVTSTNPVNNATYVDPTNIPTITAVFSEAVQIATVTSSSFYLSSGTTTYTGTVSYDNTSHTASLTVANLPYSASYTVVLTSAILDMAGNPLTAYSGSFTTKPVPMSNYCQTPPSVSAPVKPNVLIVLDNSNSMDEDMLGNAVGSTASTSKSVIARKAMINLINDYASVMNIGLMSYSVTSATNGEYLHNDFYFASYNPASYCTNPPADCNNYCVNEDATSLNNCQTTCRTEAGGNPVFDATVKDDIVNSAKTASTVKGSAARQLYCNLTYPKTQSYTANGVTVYHNVPGTLYAGSNWGTKYANATSYTPNTAGGNPINTATYSVYPTKTGATDFTGYSGSASTGQTFGPSDSDIALGFNDWGKQMYINYVNQAWFFDSDSNNPSGGYLHVPVAASNSASLLAKVGGDRTPYAFENDLAGYLSCTSSNANSCSYIVNAGNTPTAGTLRDAIKYFNGKFSQGSTFATPLQYRCQKNFIVYVTDGLPSVDESGSDKYTSGVNNGKYYAGTDLMPAVNGYLGSLACPAGNAAMTSTTCPPASVTSTSGSCQVQASLGGTCYQFDVKTYVLGVGMLAQDLPSLDSMAVTGETAVNGHAYYANNSSDLLTGLNTIFQDILNKVSSGTAASILNNSQGSGATLLQAVFYPERFFDSNTQASWVGEIQDLWYYIDPHLSYSTIREDTDGDKILDLKDDDILTYSTSSGQALVNRSKDVNGDGTITTPDTTAPGAQVYPEQVASLWRAGSTLWSRDPSSDPRAIYTVVGGSLIPFKRTIPSSTSIETSTTMQNYLQAAGSTDAATVIDYTNGIDQGTGYRNRTVTIGTGSGVWKLGDVVDSMPKLESSVPINVYNLSVPTGYGDNSYAQFIASANYQNRAMAYAGANDGMLHAFELGALTTLNTGTQKAQLSPRALRSDIPNDNNSYGREQWAFIPQNALPYLQYLSDPAYNHLYYVDAPVTLADVSIFNVPSNTTLYPGCSSSDSSTYYLCQKKTTYQSGTTIDKANTSWRTVLIGGMGLGGASRNKGVSCNSTTASIADCVNTPISNLGYSSYYALDVTDPLKPSFLWEFSGDSSNMGTLGYTLPGAAIVRVGDKGTNGRWFAIFGSGPTGPIDTGVNQFLGRSDQDLRLFVVDIATGKLLRTIDTGVANAFAGSLTTNVIDTDRWNATSAGNYQDDAVYVGYVKKAGTGDTATWTAGGVLRLLTMESTNPNDWTFQTLIDNVGPVTSSIAKLQDRSNNNLWIYFGTGRFYYKNSSAGTTDSLSNQQAIYGVLEPCYSAKSGGTQVGPMNTMYKGCFTNSLTQSNATITASNLTNQTTSPVATLPSGSPGWVINLGAAAGGFGAERVVTSPTAAPSGGVVFTTFTPTTDLCGYGGNSYLWALNYSTGGQAPPAALQGKAILQTSNSTFSMVDLGSVFTSNNNRRSLNAIQGVPPQAQLPMTIPPRPIKKILHLQEK